MTLYKYRAKVEVGGYTQAESEEEATTKIKDNFFKDWEPFAQVEIIEVRQDS